jgi:hypothetical protein
MRKVLTVLTLTAIITAPAFAQMAKLTAGTTMVGGSAMYPAKDIIDNAVNSKDHARCCRKSRRPRRNT